MNSRFDLLKNLVEDIVSDYNNPNRTISYHASYKTIEATEKYALRIAGTVASMEGNVIEVGIDSGLGALSMALTVGDHGFVHSCDIREECVQLAHERAKRLGISNVNFIHGNIDELLKQVSWNIVFAYIDGNHSEEGCFHDLDSISKVSFDDTIIALDDFADPRRGKTFGVSNAISKFITSTLGWYGMMSQSGFFLLTKNPLYNLLKCPLPSSPV